MAVDRGPLAAGAPAMVQPVQWLIRPCLQTKPTIIYELKLFNGSYSAP